MADETLYETDPVLAEGRALGYVVLMGRSLGKHGDRADRWYLRREDTEGPVGLACGYDSLPAACAALRSILRKGAGKGASRAQGPPLTKFRLGAPLDATSRILQPALDAFWREVEKQAGRRPRDVMDDRVVNEALDLAIAARKAVKAALS